jgi:hypothetical protein
MLERFRIGATLERNGRKWKSIDKKSAALKAAARTLQD